MMVDEFIVIRSKLVTTRKRHQCWKTNEWLPPGSKMINTVYRLNDQIFSVYRKVDALRHYQKTELWNEDN